MIRESVKLNLRAANPALLEQAHEAYDKGNALRFVLLAYGNQNALLLVADNVDALRHRGIYEAALLEAFTGTRANNVGWPRGIIDMLFALADRAKLLSAGHPLPDDDSFTVYRGVRGVGRRRRITTGYSWTLDRGCACWFAERYTHLPDPAVYEATINRSEVLAYYDGRQEREVICRPRRARRLGLSAEQIEAESLQWRTKIRAPLKVAC